MIDSQTVKNSATCTEKVGFDGGKLIKGRKRVYLVDSLGNLIDSFVVSANCYDATTATKYWESIQFDNSLMGNITKVFADGTFKEEMAKKYDIEVEISKIPIAKKGNLEIHPMRWIVAAVELKERLLGRIIVVGVPRIIKKTPTLF